MCFQARSLVLREENTGISAYQSEIPDRFKGGWPCTWKRRFNLLRNFGVQSTEDLPTISPVKMEDFKAEAEEEIQLQLDL